MGNKLQISRQIQRQIDFTLVLDHIKILRLFSQRVRTVLNEESLYWGVGGGRIRMGKDTLIWGACAALRARGVCWIQKRQRLTVEGKSNCQMGVESVRRGTEWSTHKSSTGDGCSHGETLIFPTQSEAVSGQQGSMLW